jgi:hypothetical protein
MFRNFADRQVDVNLQTGDPSGYSVLENLHGTPSGQRPAKFSALFHDFFRLSCLER